VNRRQALVFSVGTAGFVAIVIAIWFAITSDSYVTVGGIAFVWVLYMIVLAVIAPKTKKWATKGGVHA